MRMTIFSIAAAAAALSMTSAGRAQDQESEAPVDVLDAIECRLDPLRYMGFAFSVGMEKDGHKAFGWRKQKSGNPFLAQYRLPSPITVGGHSTETIVFSASGVMAVLDADVNALAAQEKITNQVGTADKFLGERVVSSSKETIEELAYAASVKRVLSTVASHPGKALLGCAYEVDIED